MMAAGIGLGLGAALCHSGSYIFSRLFVIRRRHAVIRLLVAAHLVMGAAAALLLPLLWSADVPPVGRYVWPLLGSAGFYLIGQVGLFFLVRRIDASRVAPLLGLKIVLLALITATVLHRPLGPLQWAGVCLAVGAAALLASAGGALGRAALGWLLLACTAYSFSDLSIQELVGSLGPLGRLHASALATCLSYVLCGAAGLALLPFAGTRRAADWAYAVPFAACWFGAMLCLYGCFAFSGVVLGGILQSTRGIISIVLGAVVARLGHVHLERKVSRGVLIGRIAAAVLMVLAVAAFVLG